MLRGFTLREQYYRTRTGRHLKVPVSRFIPRLKPVGFHAPVLPCKSWNPGQFEEPPEFTKVSDQTISVPDATQLSQAEQSEVGEGQIVMQHLTLSALYYSVEKKQFPQTLAELGLSNSATRNYRYQLQANSNQLTLIARPTKDNLKSYVAIVVKMPKPQSDGNEFSAAKACQSVRPSRIAPSMPQIQTPSRQSLYLIQCGSRSEEIAL